MVTKFLRICVFAGCPILLTDSVHAGTVGAASCSVLAVQAAINSASNGDTISVPAGTCSWSTRIDVGDKNLVIKGAGATLTRITANTSPLVDFNNSATRFTGFGITTSGDSNLLHIANGRGWRIDHNTFTNTSGSNQVCVYVRGENDDPHPVGVIDHNTFNNCRIYVNGDAGLTRGTFWSQPTGWGTNNGVFVEDNVFQYTLNQGNCVDSQYSAIYIIRFNVAVGCPIEAHSPQNGFGARSWEIYQNHSSPGNNEVMATFLRGGTGIIWGNTFDPGWSQTIRLDNVRSFSDPGGWGKCDGTKAFDGNLGSGHSYPAAGWPCRGQIGRGIDSFLFSPNSSKYPTQASEPTPIFLNRDGGEQATVRIVNGSDIHIADCRDVQVERVSFNGTCGTGVGLAANRPTSCTTGVYYWATNEGEWNSAKPGADGRLYKCTATNTWTLYYTPYSYPHPLTLGQQGSAEPAAPQNLRIVP
jgi:hypothetical protein